MFPIGLFWMLLGGVASVSITQLHVIENDVKDPYIGYLNGVQKLSDFPLQDTYLASEENC